ncbi:hypothetical protein D3C71_1673160 [compost metagenome]
MGTSTRIAEALVEDWGAVLAQAPSSRVDRAADRNVAFCICGDTGVKTGGHYGQARKACI